MPISLYTKGEDRKVSAHFSSREFDCPCTVCQGTLISSDLLAKLDALRDRIGRSLLITSGYRCENYQADLTRRGYETAKGISQHQLGNAADITDHVLLGMELAEHAVHAGFKALGIGRTWIHVDTRSDKERRWSYVKR